MNGSGMDSTMIFSSGLGTERLLLVAGFAIHLRDVGALTRKAPTKGFAQQHCNHWGKHGTKLVARIRLAANKTVAGRLQTR